MNSIVLSGSISSEVIIQHTKSNKPFCRFSFNANNQSYTCWIIGKRANKFVYDVEPGTKLIMDCIINEQMQINILDYHITDQPIRIGQVKDHNGNLLSAKKITF